MGKKKKKTLKPSLKRGCPSAGSWFTSTPEFLGSSASVHNCLLKTQFGLQVPTPPVSVPDQEKCSKLPTHAKPVSMPSQHRAQFILPFGDSPMFVDGERMSSLCVGDAELLSCDELRSSLTPAKAASKPLQYRAQFYLPFGDSPMFVYDEHSLAGKAQNTLSTEGRPHSISGESLPCRNKFECSDPPAHAKAAAAPYSIVPNFFALRGFADVCMVNDFQACAGESKPSSCDDWRLPPSPAKVVSIPSQQGHCAQFSSPFGASLGALFVGGESGFSGKAWVVRRGLSEETLKD